MDELVSEAPFMYQTELDTVTSYCFRALDGSNYDVRCDVSKLLGHLMSMALNPPKQAISTALNNIFFNCDGFWVKLAQCHRVVFFLLFVVTCFHFDTSVLDAKAKVYKLEDLLNILSVGFLKGGTGFLKASSAGEMIKGSGSINREIRVGVTHVRAH